MNSDRFTTAIGESGESPEELLERFKQSIMGENVDEFGACVAQLREKAEAGKNAGPELVAIMKALREVLTSDSATLRRWEEEEPGTAEKIQQLLSAIRGLWESRMGELEEEKGKDEK